VAFNSTFVPPMKYGQAIAEAPHRSTFSRKRRHAALLMTIAFDLAVSRDALNAIYYGPDGIKGTADDTDAILALGNNFAAAPAKAGFPSVTVPGGFILADTNPPTNDPPIGPVSPDRHVLGPAFSEPRLIGLAYAFEQATHYRVPPSSTPPLASDSVGRP
jgi:Asp-tRNA(Asn)/Glu-tRNA(Gln) amidotransferase A subunit family amidase